MSEYLRKLDNYLNSDPIERELARIEKDPTKEEHFVSLLESFEKTMGREPSELEMLELMKMVGRYNNPLLGWIKVAAVIAVATFFLYACGRGLIQVLTGAM